MNNEQRVVVSCFAFLLVFSSTVGAQQESQGNPRTQSSIARVDVEGYRRLQITTIMAHITSRPGDPYDTEVVQRDTQALRDTGYFEEVRLRVEDDRDKPNGKIVIFVVKEKPVIHRIVYRGIRSISEADIQNAYEHNGITLSVESRFDAERMTQAATVIKGLLAAHGHPSAVVKPTYERTASSNEVTILFTIDEGPAAQPAPDPR